MAEKKQMPFTKDDYFRQLDEMLTMPNQPLQPSGTSLVDKLRLAARRIKPAMTSLQ